MNKEKINFNIKNYYMTKNSNSLKIVFNELQQGALVQYLYKGRNIALDDCFDIYQDTWIQIINSSSFTISEENTFIPYFFTCLKNKTSDFFKRIEKHKHEQFSENIIHEQILEVEANIDKDDKKINFQDTNDYFDDPYEVLERKEQNQIIIEALENIDIDNEQKYRDIILFYDFIGMDYKEISKITNLSKTVLRQRRLIAKKELIKYLNIHYPSFI